MSKEITELQPSGATLELSGLPGKVFLLKRVTLLDRIKIRETDWGKELSNELSKGNEEILARFTFFLVQNKSELKVETFETFADLISGTKDTRAMNAAIKKVLGISEPDKPKEDTKNPNADSLESQ